MDVAVREKIILYNIHKMKRSKSFCKYRHVLYVMFFLLAASIIVIHERKEVAGYLSVRRKEPANWVLGLSSYSKKVYSQIGQDGIIEEIFNHIRPKNKQYVEFGFGYALDNRIESKLNGTNTYYLTKKGWSGWLFDALREHKPIGLFKELLTPGNIVDVFIKHKVPKYVDYISIDVDSVEIWLLQGLLNSSLYRPQVISIEYNPNFPYESTVTCEPRWQKWESDVVHGCSIGAIREVAGKSRYDIVHIERQLDVFLIDRDVLARSGGNALTIGDMKRLKKLPSKAHLLKNTSKLERFVDFKTFEATGDLELARSAAHDDIEALKKLHGS